MKLKTKLSLSLVFLFVVILLFGIVGILSINRLGNDTEQVLKNNHESLQYCNNMLKSLEVIKIRKDAMQLFEANLIKQEANVTEEGELDATKELRKNFTELVANPFDSSNYPEIRQSLIRIQDLNELAIMRKNSVVQATASRAKLWLTITFTILTLISFTFIFNLPSILSTPIQSLADGIKEIANKNYGKRIYLKQGDEFGELANAFNSMAGKLDEYENSNIAQMQFEKSRIETIINQMKDGIIGLDAKKNILFLNVVAQNLIGLKQADIAGKYAPDIAVINDLMRTLLQENGSANELKIYADGKESYFNKDVLDVTNNDIIIGKVIVLRNITPFHELNEAKTNFIATVSHELKTPISSIKMSAQLLSDARVGELNLEQKELAKSITDDAERLLKITGELLNMSQVETGNIQLKLQITNPATIVENAMHAVALQAQQKNITLKLEMPAKLSTVSADAEKTSWVLINFLTNAIKYSFEGTTVAIRIYEHNGRIIFSVQDHGKGIDSKYLPRLFDRYFKVPGTHERSGTGLGLAISKEFIEAQGGQVEVTSTSGEGSIFQFSFTVANG